MTEPQVDRSAPTTAAPPPELEADPGPNARGAIIGISLLIGLALSILWSAKFVDTTIGAKLADGVLGYDAKETSITGSAAGALFAFAAGLAGTFTACNVAAFSALAPMVGQEQTTQNRVRSALRPLTWVALGMIPVAAVYGAIGALLGDDLPQLSKATLGSHHFPERLIQSSVVYGILGVIFLYLGLAALKLVPDPLASLSRRWEHAPLVVMGALIGLFLVGRPFPLFYKTFQYAAEQNNALYGALVFALVSLGNIAIMALLFLLLALPGKGAVGRWLLARPGRLAAVTASGLLIAGSFTLIYWTIRLPANFGYGWFPKMWYNT
jgi:hypothetical protein